MKIHKIIYLYIFHKYIIENYKIVKRQPTDKPNPILSNSNTPIKNSQLPSPLISFPMAQTTLKVAITIITLTLLSITKSSQQQDDCVAAIISLQPCTDYITGSSSSPSAQCCLKFATVVSSEPICLCMIINGGGAQFGIKVNQTRALALPNECNVQTPPVSRCNGNIKNSDYLIITHLKLFKFNSFISFSNYYLSSICAATAPSSSISPPGGGSSNGRDSAGSFLKTLSPPIVFSVAAIVLAYLLMASMNLLI